MNRVKKLLTQCTTPHKETHEVLNQVPILENFKAYTMNTRLKECIQYYYGLTHPSLGGQVISPLLQEFGDTKVGNAEWMDHARNANENGPVFISHDRLGKRINYVRFVDSYHLVMKNAIEANVASLAWKNKPEENQDQVGRAALSYLHYQLEHGTGCPLTMTYAAFPVLYNNNANGQFTEWVEKLRSGKYDGRDVHISQKEGVMLGMLMTEKQGGSDVRAISSVAEPLDGKERFQFALTGHKWFSSAPMCDAFLTLARTSPDQISCFLVPRWLSPTQMNTGFRIQRLKNKMGDKANASSEVEYDKAVGYLVGKEGRGIPTIIDMVNHTRLDCLIGSASLMQLGVYHAMQYTSHRNAFGKLLIDSPLMQNVLCDLAVEAEAATAVAMRLAYFHNAPVQKQSSTNEAFKRIATAIAKYFVCKRCSSVVYESMECMGGNGYVEDFPMPRMFRQSPLNAIWEGSGNVIVLDVFRALHKEKEALVALQAEMETTNSPFLMEKFKSVIRRIEEGKSSGPENLQLIGRQIVEDLGLLLEASALQKCGSPLVYEVFVKSRLEQSKRIQFGTLPPECVSNDILARHAPLFV